VKDLAAATGQPADRLARADALVLHALGALVALARDVGSLAGAGIVVGSALTTLETNARFAARIRERGARMAEPRRFPYTSPNAVAGECGVVFGLRGPAFTVGAGLHAGLEALAAATYLVRAGDADRIVVVAVEQVEETGQRCAAAGGFPHLASGAVAVMVSRNPGSAVARIGAIHLPLPLRARDPGCATQDPLLALAPPRPGEAGFAPRRPSHLTVHPDAQDPASRASIALEWLPHLT
jgi:3-oxoacyl-[acyl-carrier-protein] synthase II